MANLSISNSASVSSGDSSAATCGRAAYFAANFCARYYDVLICLSEGLALKITPLQEGERKLLAGVVHICSGQASLDIAANGSA
jgi:hypothetical protein